MNRKDHLNGRDSEKSARQEFERAAESYLSILEATELDEISLISLKADRLVSLDEVGVLTLDIKHRYEYHQFENSVGVVVRHRFTAKSGRKSVVRIDCEHLAEFHSEEAWTDEFMEFFDAQVLDPMIWPYLRETVQSTLGKMGLPPLTLPLLKI